MRRTRIKFCGITRPADAVAAAGAGADAIGLIFYSGSSRCVSISQARDILRVLPPMLTPVGLFVDHDPVAVGHIAAELHLCTVQLHGNETPEYIAQLPGLSVIKALHFDPQTFSNSLQLWGTKVSGLLLETAGTGQHGGAGIENNWDAIELATGSGLTVPLIVAGGLTPENVGRVVCRLGPWAVDVSTGIEESPGIKSIDKMQRFAKAVRDADIMMDRS